VSARTVVPGADYERQYAAEASRRAGARLDALAAYAKSAEREELLAAGVSATTVASLYPYSMEELFKAADKAVLRRGLDHLDGSEDWELYRDSLDDVRQSLPEALYEEIDEEYEAFMNLPLFTQLFNAIDRRLKGFDSEGRAEAMVTSFWHVCYFKLNATQLPLSEANIDGCFCMVMDWIFRDLVPGDRW
jgi:hypothetical protein